MSLITELSPAPNLLLEIRLCLTWSMLIHWFRLTSEPRVPLCGDYSCGTVHLRFYLFFYSYVYLQMCRHVCVVPMVDIFLNFCSPCVLSF